MVQNQIIRRGITNERVLDALRKVPRHLFIPKTNQADAYADHPLSIGEGQTISQPYIVALMTSHLQLMGNEKVLEIGTGSGYQTAILAALVKEVFSIELINKLSDNALKIFQQLGYTNIILNVGDGSGGWKAHAPYDRIIVTAAVPELSDEIKAQVANDGIIVAPVGGRWRQEIEVWTNKGSRFNKKTILPVVFVPLRGQHGWQD